jgi:5,5'-dehydrodivanillate O-demethylase
MSLTNNTAAGSKDLDAAVKDYAHTGPGTLAGRYLRMFWQPVSRSQDVLAGRAKPIKIMSEDFTLYRGETGKAHLVDFRCAHRRTQLSVGTVEQDSIRCFYHGWKYDHTGQCVEQPAEKKSSCAKVRIRSYPVQEHWGLIYAYLGEGEPPAFPRYRHLEGAPEESIEVEAVIRRYNYFQNVENGCFDPTHLNWVHATIADTYERGTDEAVLSAEESIWGITVYSDRPSGRRTINQYGMPNIFWAEQPGSFRLENVPADLKSGPGFCELTNGYVPIDDESHYQFQVTRVGFSGKAAELYRAERARLAAKRDLRREDLVEDILAGKIRLADVDPARTDIIRLQDDVAQIGQGRITDRSKEHLGRSDVAIVLLRRIWTRELRALAEGKPLKQWADNEGVLRTHRNIPSPASNSAKEETV